MSLDYVAKKVVNGTIVTIHGFEGVATISIDTTLFFDVDDLSPPPSQLEVDGKPPGP